MPWRYGQENTFSRDLDGERDSMEFAFLKQAVSAGKPVLAICRGMQVVNVFFGGTLCQDLPGHSRLSGGIDRLHYARTAPSFLTPLYGAAQIINSAHHQAAACLGNGLRAVQWAPDGTVEALEHTSMPIYARPVASGADAGPICHVRSNCRRPPVPCFFKSMRPEKIRKNGLTSVFIYVNISKLTISIGGQTQV